MSWMEEEERILSIEHKLQKEVMTSIKCHFFYINMNQYIDKIDIEELEFVGDGFPADKLIGIIQSKKKYTTNTKYVLQDLFLYHIDLEPEHIQGFDVSYSSQFFRKISMVEDVKIPPSIFVFHSINGLFFFFYETLLSKTKEPKSILRPHTHKNIKPSDLGDLTTSSAKLSKRVILSSGGSGRKTRRRRFGTNG
jgi:hypothetical protein